jgi:hypothetical protein
MCNPYGVGLLADFLPTNMQPATRVEIISNIIVYNYATRYAGWKIQMNNLLLLNLNFEM